MTLEYFMQWLEFKVRELSNAPEGYTTFSVLYGHQVLLKQRYDASLGEITYYIVVSGTKFTTILSAFEAIQK